MGNRTTYDDAVERGEAHGFTLLTLPQHWENASRPARWRCTDGHVFSRSLTVLSSTGRCPHCAMSRGESLCRQAFQHSYGAAFPRVRPDWLINPATGQRLELDGYNAGLKIAFEYQGPHHRQTAVRARDMLKEALCAVQGVRLIAVDMFERMDRDGDVFTWVQAAIARAGIKPRAAKTNFVSNRVTADELDKIMATVARKGGAMIAARFPSIKAPLHVRCSAGHNILLSGGQILDGDWCPFCARHAARERIERLAETQGFALVSLHKRHTSASLRCDHGHTFHASVRDVRHWEARCPKCCSGKSKSHKRSPRDFARFDEACF